MKKLFLITSLVLIASVAPAAIQGPSIPNKAFDTREANGIIDNGTTYAAAIVIPFKNTAAQTKFYNDYADNNNWANANPQPTKKKFALDGLKQWMKDQSTQARQKASAAAAPAVDTTDLP